MELKTGFQKIQNFLSKNRKNVLIASVLIVAIGLPIILFMRAREVRSWYNSSWELRKAITISYSGSPLTDEDVLIELDTAALISSSKLQSDCDDLRFIDSNDSTLLSYWIESGCNTSATQVWVRIPSVPDGGKTIYNYYGNAGASNAQQSWSGNFIMLYNSSCPTGWTRDDSFDNRFIYGDNTYGSTGGGTIHSHNHSVSGSIAGISNTTQGDSGAPNGIRIAGHTHSVSFSTATTSSISPPYLNMVVCEKQELLIESGLIGIFDQSAPTGWTRFSALDSRLPRGSATYGGTGGNTTHTHTYSSSSTGAATGGLTQITEGGSSVAFKDHSHTVNGGTTAAGNHMPPYTEVVFASKNSSGVALSNLILMSSALPPLGWEEFSALNGRFTYGSTNYGATGGASSHTHTVNITTGTPSSTEGGLNLDPGPELAPTNHTHSASLTSSSVSNLPSYTTTQFIKRKISSVSYQLESEETENTKPTTPSLDSPPDESVSIGLTPQLKTTTTDLESDYLRYRIQLCENEEMDLNCQNFDQSASQTGWSGQNAQTSTAYTSGTQATYIIQTPLNLSTTYYWRSYAIDPGGKNQESDTQSSPFSFTTSATPAIPILNSPTNSATNQNIKPQLKMVSTDLDNDYIRYKVEVCTDNSMTLNCNTYDQTISQSGWSGQNTQAGTAYTSSTEATYTVQTALNPQTAYYWRASATDPAGTNIFSDTSLIRSFTTSQAPNPPTALQTEGAVNPTQVEDVTPEFSAIHTDPDEDSAVSYRIQVNTASDFTGTMMWDSNKQGMTSTSHSNRSPEIPYAGTAIPKDGTKYYWRIKFWDSKDAESPWSQVANFTMWRLPMPGGCYLVKANDNSQITINWTDTNSTEDGYRIERKVNAGSFTLLTTKAADSISHVDSTVSNGNTYQYRIAATLGSDLSPWCTTNIMNLQLNHFLIF